MAKYKYQSVFAKEMTQYLEFKKACGRNPESLRRILNVFDKFCVKRGITETIFTKADAEAWTQKRDNECFKTLVDRTSAVKGFLAYLLSKGYQVFIPRNVAYKPTGFAPHIYSQEEVARYFKAVDHFSSKCGKDAIQYPVLFRILYCCGTRIEETLSIRKCDIDLDAGVILLRRTKGRKERLLPVGEDLLKLLRTFAQKCFHEIDDSGWVFTNSRGSRMDQKMVYKRHRQFLREAAIAYRGSHCGPRVHDWRHTFAVNAFK